MKFYYNKGVKIKNFINKYVLPKYNYFKLSSVVPITKDKYLSANSIYEIDHADDLPQLHIKVNDSVIGVDLMEGTFCDASGTENIEYDMDQNYFEFLEHKYDFEKIFLEIFKELKLIDEGDIIEFIKLGDFMINLIDERLERSILKFSPFTIYLMNEPKDTEETLKIYAIFRGCVYKLIKEYDLEGANNYLEICIKNHFDIII